MSTIVRRPAMPGLGEGEIPSRRRLYKAAAEHGVFVVAPIVLTGFVLYAAIRMRAFAVDFHNGEWTAGQRLLDGLSPYFAPNSAAVLSAGSPHPTVTPFVYPAVAALMYAGLALIPHYAADGLFTAVDMAAVVGALKLIGVRDWRLYGLVFLWPPVVIGWQTANITLLLVLGIAAVWHYRGRPMASGLVVALVISLKIVLWPLALWLLAMRRYRAFAYALVSAVISNVVAWAVVGYEEIPRYFQVLQSFGRAGERRAYSVVNLVLHLQGSTRLATAVGYLVTAVLAVLCLKSGRAGRERVAFVLAIATVLAATPISWLHYFALLLVPLALVRPRFGPAWLLPLLMFSCPPTEPAAWQIELVLAITVVLLGRMIHAELVSARAEPSSGDAGEAIGSFTYAHAEAGAGRP